MKNARSHLALFLCLSLCVVLVACTETEAINNLDKAAGLAAEVAQFANQLPADYAKWAAAAIDALDCSDGVIDKGGTTTQVSLAIGQCGLTAVAPALPPGTDQNAANAANQFVSAIAVILKEYQPMASAARAQPVKTVSVTFFGHRKLRGIHKKLQLAKSKFVKKTASLEGAEIKSIATENDMKTWLKVTF